MPEHAEVKGGGLHTRYRVSERQPGHESKLFQAARTEAETAAAYS